MVHAAQIKEWAAKLGFDLAGIAPATPAETRAFYQEWVEAGHAGEMGYMARDPARRSVPARVWPDVATIVVVGLNYKQAGAGMEAWKNGGVEDPDRPALPLLHSSTLPPVASRQT